MDNIELGWMLNVNNKMRMMIECKLCIAKDNDDAQHDEQVERSRNFPVSVTPISLWAVICLWVSEGGFAQCDAMGTPPPTSICDTRDGDDEDGDNSGKYDDTGR